MNTYQTTEVARIIGVHPKKMDIAFLRIFT